MHLSTGNVIAILSLIVAIPCTAIMLWTVYRRQQRVFPSQGSLPYRTAIYKLIF